MTKHVDWYGLYSDGWGDDIVPDAYSHPAKYARGLIRQIYRYALEQGYLKAGDHVVDPFGGVALGSLDAARYGLNWTGVELEEKFVALGNANIDLWRGRYAPHFPGWGEARLLQGDSRQLCRVIGDAAAVVSSPPYAYSVNQRGNGIDTSKFKGNDSTRDFGNGRSNVETDMHYGSTPGQLGSMREGSYAAVVTSPPFGEQVSGGGIAASLAGTSDYQTTIERAGPGCKAQGYVRQGTSAGNLAALKADDTGYAAAVSSPPYADQLNNWNEGAGARFDPAGHPGNPNKRSSDNGYGVTDGNLGHMSACVSSPPYEGSIDDAPGNKNWHGAMPGNIKNDPFYGASAGQVGIETGETFWSAAALIVGQVYQVLKPGGYTFWVCKNFVRNKKIVPFSDQWQALCEAHGFVTTERIRAWVVEDNGTQGNMFGDDKVLRKERKSFFRRLAEKNGSPRIDWEDVIVMTKPLF